MKRCVIIGGAPIADYEKIKEYLRADDYFICCDCGLDHAEGLGITPDLIVGDFDSHEKPETDTETITLPREKADTDTYYAAKEGIKRGFDDFLIIGGAGGRIDHTLANIYLLYFLYERNKKAVMIDDFSEMEIAGSNPVYVSDDYPYFSLVNIAGKAEGITIKNAKYPLDGESITPGYQYGFSNEVLPGKRAEITVKEGSLLLVKDR